MVNGNKIVILEEYQTFKLLDSFESSQIFKSREIYSCSGIKEWKQRIQFWDSISETTITMDFYDRNGITQVMPLSGSIFNRAQYQNLCKTFNLKLRDEYQLYAEIPIEGQSRIAHLAIRNFENSTFCIVYNLDDGESRRDATLYIHGIWKVVLPEFIKGKLSNL